MVTRHSAFLCLCLRLNCKDLSLFRQNGEFEKSAFRRAEIRKNPPKFSVWRFSGTREFAKLQVLDIQRKFLKIPFDFLVSPMNAMENFVLRTAVLLAFSFTVKELQENQRFLFSSQMHTRV